SGPTPARAEGTTWWALLGAFGFVAVIRFGWFRHNIVLHETLKFKTRFSGGIGQGFDFSVITRAAPIENDLSDAFAKSGLGGQSAESCCAGSIGCELLTVGSGFAGGRSRCERYAGGVINKLDVDIFVGEADTHPRSIFGAGNLLTDAPAATHSQLMFLFGSH